jgi:hypothetical protein
MIAAALEDTRYPLEELVLHLANLRGGGRFHDHSGSSERLATASRAIYGHVDDEGYLRAGLAEAYGEGAWETIERYLAGGAQALDSELRRGDVERATLEWKSLLRHIVHAPDADAPRWRELQTAAAQCLEAHAAGETALVEPLVPIAFRRRAAETPMRTDFASRR